MKILTLEIDNYKSLKNFKFISNERLYSSLDTPNLSFFIGKNGSGKTTFLEVVIQIFTKLMLNQDVGFPFYMKYEIEPKGLKASGKKTIVIVHNKNHHDKNKLCLLTYSDQIGSSSLSIRDEDFKIEESPFYERVDLHPEKIFTVGSGPKNDFEHIMVNDPINILSEKILTANNESLNFKKAYENFLFNPRILNFQDETLIYILISLLFFSPFDYMNDSDEDKKNNDYCKNINVLKSDTRNFEEKAFSLKINLEKIESIKKLVEDDFYESNAPSIFLDNFESIFSNLISESVSQEKCMIYFFEKDKMFSEIILKETKNENYGPMNILTTLMISYRLGIIENATVYLNNKDDEDLFTEKIFSDGEWYWLCKMSLVMLCQIGEEKNMLLLFDEPEAFLNEGWIEGFIDNIDKFSNSINIDGRDNSNEYLIVTHSVLMLTDALRKQVYQFKQQDEKVLCSNIDFNTFGADRGYISSKLFLEDSRTGNFVERKIKEAINPEQLKEILNELGQGYDRFAVQELYLKTKK